MQGEVVTAIVADYLRKVMELRELEPAFLDVARQYSANRGITREAWLTFGVAPTVLDAAGILEVGGGLRLAT